MRDKPRGSLSVEGGGFKPGERLPSGEEVPVTNKGKLTADEQAYQKELQQRRADLSGVPDDGTDPTNAKRLARTRNRVAGKRPDGPMNDLGLEWSDIFRRDSDDSLQRAKMMAGLEDIGGYRMRRDWVPRMMKLDLDDEAAVKKFWTDARTAAGLDEQNMPLVDFDPDISGQSYLGAADTLTKNDAMTLVNRTLIRDADTAVKTLRRLQREGAPAGDIKSAQDEVRAALGRTGLDIESFPENQLPILAKVAEGLGARIEREWPEDRVAMPGKKGVEEDVAKKRQLLGLFDQGIKKEQKLAGLPVTGMQDCPVLRHQQRADDPPLPPGGHPGVGDEHDQRAVAERAARQLRRGQAAAPGHRPRLRPAHQRGPAQAGGGDQGPGDGQRHALVHRHPPRSQRQGRPGEGPGHRAVAVHG